MAEWCCPAPSDTNVRKCTTSTNTKNKYNEYKYKYNKYKRAPTGRVVQRVCCRRQVAQLPRVL